MFSVFIVEDDDMVAELHRRYIEQCNGFRVVGTARDGSEAATRLRGQNVDLVLLDLYLPGKHGLDLLKELHALTEKTDVIVITAGKEPESVETALRRGAFDYLVKPFRPERLFHSLKRYEEFRRRVESEPRVIDQREIDRLLSHRTVVSFSAELPKGVDAMTLDRIWRVVSSLDEPRSAEQIGDAAGVSRSTARRYLEYLAGMGYVKLYLRYGQVGRPERLYGREKNEQKR